MTAFKYLPEKIEDKSFVDNIRKAYAEEGNQDAIDKIEKKLFDLELVYQLKRIADGLRK